MHKMLDFIKAYIKPDATAPNIGDQDDARLHPFTIQSNLDHRYLLGIGYYTLDRHDLSQYEKFAVKENAIMNLKHRDSGIDSNNPKGCILQFDYSHVSGIPISNKTYEQNSKSLSFPDAGFYIIKNNADYMFINCSGKGKYPELCCGGHTHADLLSYELCIDGRSFLVDPGSFTYTSDPNQRMKFRSTFMHNTMVVDNQNQCTIQKEILWDIGNEAKPTAICWEENDDVVSFMGKHNGYCRLSCPIIHLRRIDYHKKERSWTITDIASGTGKHTYDVYFHFDESIPVRIAGNSVFTDCNLGNNIELEFSSNAVLELEIADDYISKSYGSKLPAKVLIVKASTICPYELVTIIKRK